jgi:hypothetical protein
MEVEISVKRSNKKGWRGPIAIGRQTLDAKPWTANHLECQTLDAKPLTANHLG